MGTPMNATRKVIVLALMLLFAGAALAGTVKVKVPGGWKITFETPHLSNKRQSQEGDRFVFAATSGRLDILLFVEPPGGPGSTHKDCYAVLWPKASQNPLIEKKSVKTTETLDFVRVSYDVLLKTGTQPTRQKHVNYYFTFNGKWVDLHVSLTAPTPADENVLATFDRSLRYGM